VPAGTVTFLLTDIEGSTRLWANAPTAMPDAIARQYEILGEVIARHGGGCALGWLTGGERGALPRLQTLRASVDWSHELLDALGLRNRSEVAAEAMRRQSAGPV
jgi:hypothetical protein